MKLNGTQQISKKLRETLEIVKDPYGTQRNSKDLKRIHKNPKEL